MHLDVNNNLKSKEPKKEIITCIFDNSDVSFKYKKDSSELKYQLYKDIKNEQPKGDLNDKEEVSRSNEKYKKEFPKGTPIVVACEKGRLEDLKVFVAGHDVDGTGVTVKQLLEKVGKDSNGWERNTLMVSACKERHEVLVQILEYDCDPTIITPFGGWNALHYIAENNNTSTRCTELLLKKMPLESINKKDKYESSSPEGGRTPLDIAYQNGSHEIVQLIRQHGGKGNNHDRDGEFVGNGKGDLND
eukprot:g3087.t1